MKEFTRALKIIITVLCLIVFFLPCNVHAATQATFYVSTTGTGDYSQANPGSLSGILTKVRTVNSSMTGDIVVILRGGTYNLTSTFALGSTDGGTNGYSIIYQAYTGEIPVFSGGQNVSGGWGIADAGKNIYSKNVGTSIDTRQLYVNGGRATRARSVDGSGWSTQNSNNGDGVFNCPSGFSSWQNTNKVEVVIPSVWAFLRSKISSVSGTTAQGTTFHTRTNGQITSQDAGHQYIAWIENAYELLDAEGEWYLNRSTGVLYYKPRSGENMSTAEVILAKLETIVSGAGINYVQFKGITFSHGTWLYPNSYGVDNEQADGYTWDHQTFQSGNVSFSSSSNIRFENNTFTHLGQTALRFPSGNNNTISNNTFHDISGSGISIGNVSSLTSGSQTTNIMIDNNLIDNVAVEYKGSVGIFILYTENTRITHNEIRNLPYAGISMGWGWSNTTLASKNCEIDTNLIENTMSLLWDGAAIYTLSAQPGSTIHDNYIRNSGHGYAMYPDEGSKDGHWYNNVLDQYSGYWMHIWTSTIQNLTVDYNWYNGNGVLNNGTNCTLSNNTPISGAWPETAQTIINNAGRNSSGTYSDAINSVSGPTSASIGNTVSVNVGYGAITNRDIVVDFKLWADPWTTQSTQRVSVTAGTGTAVINVSIPSTVTVGSNYSYLAYMVPTGSDFSQKTADKVQTGISAVNATYSDAINSVSGSTSVTIGNTVSVNVSYGASTNRDIVVEFKLWADPWTTHSTQRVPVTAGTGTAVVNVSIPSTVTVGSNYSYLAYMVPTGSDFSQKTADKVQSGISAISGGLGLTVTANGGNSGGGEDIDKLTDGNLYTKWLDFSSMSWVLFTYGTAQTWNKYDITSGNDSPGRDPKNWTLQGSNDGSTWTTLDTRTNQSWANRNSTQSYTFANSTAYKYYKWNITANNGDGIIQASEFTFSSDCPNTAALTARGGDLGGLMDGDKYTTKWFDASSTSWVQFDYSCSKIWNNYEITSGNDVPNRDPKNWTVQGSNNGTSWTTLDTRTNQSWTGRNVTNSYTFTNPTAYKYYKWDITANNGAGEIQVSEFTPYNGQSALKAGSIALQEKELQLNGVQLFVYPNPVADVINIRMDGQTQDAETTIHSIEGKSVYSGILRIGESLKIGKDNLKPGLYMLKVTGKDINEVRKVIVK